MQNMWVRKGGRRPSAVGEQLGDILKVDGKAREAVGGRKMLSVWEK